MDAWIPALPALLALPRFGLGTVFVISHLSATLLLLGSEPAVFGLARLNPGLFWPAVAVATLGSTLGGAVTGWMGRVTERRFERVRHRKPPDARALRWLERFGAKACVLAGLPVVGDPRCAVAGWLGLPFWRCTAWMAIGKGVRYVVATGGFLWLWPGPCAG